MARPPPPLQLSKKERSALEGIAASVSLPHRAVREAKGLLMAGDGVANSSIAEALGVSRSTVLRATAPLPCSPPSTSSPASSSVSASHGIATRSSWPSCVSVTALAPTPDSPAVGALRADPLPSTFAGADVQA
jgi:hypothetical protein